MPNNSKKITSVLSVLATTILYTLMPAHVFGSESSLSSAGRMYDKWWVEAGLEVPKGTHPAYPKVGKKKGSSTWRCKECHGWDYRGDKGAYASGSHFTGIGGVRSFSGKAVNKIVNILGNNTHRYNTVMSKKDLAKIARFISKGQVDMDKIINRKTRLAKGKAEKGKSIFVEYCKSCHGADGRNYNFKAKAGKKEYLGTVANKNPWEALHKLINGHPGASSDKKMGMHGDSMGAGHIRMFMPGMRGRISDPRYADLLAYLQSLPE